MGRSYEGRELWMLKISDNVATDESEPEVLITGLTHAREHLTVEQALAVIHWLVDGYGSSQRITRIVNTTELWIVPMLNPDGGQWDIRSGKYHMLAQESTAHARLEGHRHGHQPQLRVSLGMLRRLGLVAVRHRVPGTAALLDARGGS